MQMINQRLNWRLLVGLAIILTMLVPSYTMAASLSLFVNGKSVPTSKGQPVQRGGVTYLPLNSVVPGMGGKYSFSKKYDIATITKGKDQYKITIGKNVAVIGKKSIPLSTKIILKDKKKVVVNAGNRALVINDVMYVPSEFVQKVLGYPVSTKGNVVYVGKVPTTTAKPQQPVDKYAPPAGWVAPTVNTTATDNLVRNIQVLSDQLGLYKTSDYSAYFNPYKKTSGPESLLVFSDPSYGYDVQIQIDVWVNSHDINYNKTPYIAKELFKFYQVSGVYDIVRDGFMGVDVTTKMNRTLTFGDRQVRIVGVLDSCAVWISKPGKPLVIK